MAPDAQPTPETTPPSRPFQSRRIFQYRLRTLFVVIAGISIFLATNGFGLVGLHYPRAVENDPLIAPIRVTSIQNDLLHLADGRVFRVDAINTPLAQTIKATDMRVEIQTQSGSTDVIVYAKQRGWICGTPWARHVINLPLIPDDVPINRRGLVGVGYPVANQTTPIAAPPVVPTPLRSLK